MLEPPSDPVGPAELHRWAQALAGVARTGLGFTSSIFEAERYEEILQIAADIQVAALASDDQAVTEAETSYDDDDSPAATEGASIISTWRDSIRPGIAGYVTPKVAVGAIVGDHHGRLLLIKRADSGVWLYPTGWADIGYSPAEVVTKEVHEETGIRCEVKSLVGVVDGLRAGFSQVPLYSLLFYCEARGGELAAHPTECLDVGWFAADELPSPLVGFERWGSLAFDAIAGKAPEPIFDHPRNPVWQKPAEP